MRAGAVRGCECVEVCWCTRWTGVLQESANRGGECDLHVWIGMVCVVVILGGMDPSEVGGE